jgi:hypothetical protein
MVKHASKILILAVCALVAGPAAAHGTGGGTAGHDARIAGRNVLSLDVYAAGDTIDLLTAESTGAGAAPGLWYRRSADGGKSWTAPSRVGEGMPIPHHPHRSNDPQVASNGKQVIAVWASAGRGFRSSGPMVTALSNDGGKTWRRGPNPADDNRHDGHGFADVAARDGRFHLTWLDSRSGSQGVRYARSADAGATWSANMSVKSGSCECCWNTLLPASDRGVYLLYRGKGPRDMGLVASEDAGATWKAAGPVGAFNWQIQACPHTGGALALTGNGASSRLHALVWTGKEGERGVHYYASKSGGADWTTHARLGGELAQRADLASRGDELAAVWDETVGQTGAVFLARSRNAGAEWSKPMRLSSESASATYPRIVASRSNLLALWTETAAGETQLRMVLLK